MTIRLWNLESGYKHTLEGHTGWVVAIAFSPDSKYIASGSNDKTIKLWDLTGQCKRTIEGHTDQITAVAFSPDGEQIASSSYDSTIKLWNVAEALRPPNFLERKFTRHSKLVFEREIKTTQVVKLMQYSQGGGTIFTNVGVFLVNTAVQVHTYRELCVRGMWLCYGKLRLLRLAPDFEVDCQHAHGDRIAIGLRNGRVLIFDIDRAAFDEGRI
jgi:WD40 repeat protein